MNICRKVNLFPDTTPIINNMSTYITKAGDYTVVHIIGENFSLDGSTGYSVVLFGKIEVPVIFYNSQHISFVVPLNEKKGEYNIKVINKNYFQRNLYSNVHFFEII